MSKIETYRDDQEYAEDIFSNIWHVEKVFGEVVPIRIRLYVASCRSYADTQDLPLNIYYTRYKLLNKLQDNIIENKVIQSYITNAKVLKYRIHKIFYNLFMDNIAMRLNDEIVPTELRYTDRTKQEIKQKFNNDKIPDIICAYVLEGIHNYNNWLDLHIRDADATNVIIKVMEDSVTIKYKSFEETIKKSIYDRICKDFENNGSGDVNVYIAKLLLAYNALPCYGSQAAVPDKFYNLMDELFNEDYITTECFASTLSHNRKFEFCSAYSIDKFFGSIGNAFTLETKCFHKKRKVIGNDIILQGLFVANPPFHEYLSEAFAYFIANAIEKRIKYDSQMSKRLTFIFVHVSWSDAAFNRIINMCPHVMKRVLLKDTHKYVDEMENVKNRKAFTLRADTIIYAISNAPFTQHEQYVFHTNISWENVTVITY